MLKNMKNDLIKLVNKIRLLGEFLGNSVFVLLLKIIENNSYYFKSFIEIVSKRNENTKGVLQHSTDRISQ